MKHEKQNNTCPPNNGDNTGIFMVRKLYLGAIRRLRVLPYAFRYITLFLGVLVIGLVYATIPARAAGTTLFEAEDTNASVTFKRDGGNPYFLAVNYVPDASQYVCSVDIELAKTNSPTGNIQVLLYQDINNSVSALSSTLFTLITSGVHLNTTNAVSASTLTGSLVSYTLDFPNCQYLTGSITYTFVIYADGAESSTNLVNFGYKTSNPYSDKLRLAWNITSAMTVPNAWTFYSAATQPYIKITGYDTLDIPLQNVGATSSLLEHLFTGFSANDRSCSDDAVASTTLAKISCYFLQAGERFIDLLFIPNPSSTGVYIFKEGLERFATVFPFNIFFHMGSVLSELTTETVTDNTISMTFPSPLSGTFTISSSTLNTFMGSSTYSTVRTYESWVIWILLAAGILTTVGLL